MKNRPPKTILAALLASAAVLVRATPEPYAIIEIDSVDAVTRDFAALGNTLRNPALMGGPAQAGFMLGSPGFVGIDKGKPLRLVFPSERDLIGNRPVVVVPVSDTDGTAYLSSFGAIAEKTGDENGLLSFRGRQFPMDFRLRVAGGHALFTTSGSIGERALSDKAASLTADPDAFAVRGLSGTIRADLSVAAVLPAIEGLIREGLESIEDDEDRSTARVLADEVKTLLRGASRIGIGLEFDAEHGLSIWTRLDAVPDSSLAQSLHDCHVPSERLLPHGGNFSVFQSSGCDAAVTRLLTPLISALSKVVPADDTDNLQSIFATLVDQMKEYQENDFSYVAGLRRNADGRLFLQYAIAGDESWIAERAEKTLMGDQKDLIARQGIAFGEVSTREEQGATIRFLPIETVPEPGDEDDDAKALDDPFGVQNDIMKYFAEQRYGYEWTVKDGLFHFTFGPQGSILPCLAPADGASADPMAALFPDVDNRAQAAYSFLVNVPALLDDILSIPEVKGLENYEDIQSTLWSATEKDRNFLGSLVLVRDDSAVGVLRLTPAFIRSIAAVGEAVENILDNGGDDTPLTNEDIDALLKEAEED